MKTILVAILIIVCGQVIEAQNSSLYYPTGALRIDTTYKVRTEYLKYITTYESDNVFHQIYENIEYPKKCYENNVGGIVIVKIVLNRQDLKISCIVESANDERLGRAVIDAVYKSSLHLFKSTQTLDNIVFYLPFKFEVKSDRFDNDMEKHGLIRIEKAFHEGRQYVL